MLNVGSTLNIAWAPTGPKRAGGRAKMKIETDACARG